MGPLLFMAYTATLVTAARFTEVNPGGGGFFVDLANLQWWQSLIGIIGVLGLSPAPWILGLATNKIEFVAPAAARHAAALAEQARHYEALLVVQAQRYASLEKSNEANEAAIQTQRDRAEAATDAALVAVDVIRQNTHVLEGLNQIAREATGTS